MSLLRSGRFSAQLHQWHPHTLPHKCTYRCIITCWTPSAHTALTQNDRARSAIVLPLDWYRDSDSSRTVGLIPNHTQGSTTSETSWIILCLRGHMSLHKKPSLISCFVFFRHYHSFLSSEKKKEKTPVPHQSERERQRTRLSVWI